MVAALPAPSTPTPTIQTSSGRACLSVPGSATRMMRFDLVADGSFDGLRSVRSPCLRWLRAVSRSWEAVLTLMSAEKRTSSSCPRSWSSNAPRVPPRRPQPAYEAAARLGEAIGERPAGLGLDPPRFLGLGLGDCPLGILLLAKDLRGVGVGSRLLFLAPALPLLRFGRLLQPVGLLLLGLRHGSAGPRAGGLRSGVLPAGSVAPALALAAGGFGSMALAERGPGRASPCAGDLFGQIGGSACRQNARNDQTQGEDHRHRHDDEQGGRAHRERSGGGLRGCGMAALVEVNDCDFNRGLSLALASGRVLPDAHAATGLSGAWIDGAVLRLPRVVPGFSARGPSVRAPRRARFR